MGLLFKELSDQIIKAYFKVYNKLGFGFLEKVYENALCLELEKCNLQIRQQVPVDVYYENVIVGYYKADVIVENKIIIEIKAAEALCEAHECQLINYLKATDFEVGLLFNFGKEPQLKRKIFQKKPDPLLNPSDPLNLRSKSSS
jgi:GxxExxY protein